MSCSQCPTKLEGARKFCSECGAPVKPAIDPFASTAKPHAGAASVPIPTPSEPGAASASRPSHPISPLASSSFEYSESVREIVAAREGGGDDDVDDDARVPPKSASRLGGTVQMKQAPLRPAAKPASVIPPSFGVSSSPNAALGPGMAVRVRWADGQRYPGTVWQVRGAQVLVSFPNGQRLWVEASFVERT